jgi:hypothetical protein
MGRPQEGYLSKRLELLKEFESTFGKTTFITESEAMANDQTLIWHVKAESDSSGWLNGLSDSKDSVDYWRAEHPWAGGPGTIYVVTDEFFDCPNCEGGSIADLDECEDCDGFGCIVIDYESVLLEMTGDVSEDDIWAMRESQ